MWHSLTLFELQRGLVLDGWGIEAKLSSNNWEEEKKQPVHEAGQVSKCLKVGDGYVIEEGWLRICVRAVLKSKA